MWSYLLLALPLLQDAPAPESSPEPTPPAVFTPLLSVDCTGLEGLLVDPKDQKLRAALQLLDDRLLDLPGEIPDFNAPPGGLELLVRLLGTPTNLTVGLNSEAIVGMPMPFAGELRLTQGSAEAASALANDIAHFLQQNGAPLADPEEGQGWVLPAPVPMWLTSSEDGTVLRLGLEDGVQAPNMSGLLPEGMQMSSSGMLDYGKLMGMMMPMMGAGDEAFMTIMRLSMVDQMLIEWASGTDADRSLTVTNLRDWGGAAREAGLLSSQDLDASIVEAIPADSTWATMSTLNVRGILGFYEELLRAVSEDESLSFQGLLSEVSDIDLEEDILSAVGNQFALYGSDSTGGGGLLSTVMLMELGDRAAFDSSWAKLEQNVARLSQENAQGYVRFNHIVEDGHDLTTLSFPGLPFPMELTLSTTDSYVVLGATPGAVLGALDQIQSGASTSLLSNKHFQEQLPMNAEGTGADMQGVLTVSWLNTPRLMRDGYGMVSLACSGLANMVQNPKDPSRNPGVILPSYGKLHQGAKGMVSVGRLVGADLRTEMRGDRSVLVNATGIVGYFGSSPMVLFLAIGMGAGVALPRIQEVEQQAAVAAERHAQRAAEDAQLIESMSLDAKRQQVATEQIGSIYLALEAYAANNEGAFPATLVPLTTKDENGNAYMDESLLTDPWGDPYAYEAPNAEHAEPLVWAE